MKKLTRERIYEIAGGNRSTYEIARAIEAEVLRLNGDAVSSERAACAELCRRLYEESMADGYECEQAILARGNALDEKPNETVYKSADELFDALGIDTNPRATGCPETMDDTGHFAEVDMPAFLRKQAG